MAAEGNQKNDGDQQAEQIAVEPTVEGTQKTAFDVVYLEELKWIKERRQHLRRTENLPSSEKDEQDQDGKEIDEWIPTEMGPLGDLQTKALQADLCGLAISGGGIRSATFGLGVLQGLAASGLLPRFDYLSTVSGGGFIGAWFSAWVNRSGFGEVQSKLLPPRLQNEPAARVEAEPIRHLRLYSNYLAPRPGLFSFDGWALIAIYLRNLMLNQLVLLLAVLALFAGVRTIVEFFSMVHAQSSDNLCVFCCAGAALVPLIAAILGSAGFAPGGRWRKELSEFSCLSWFWVTCVLSWVLAAFFASLLFAAPAAIGWFHGNESVWNLLLTVVVFSLLHALLGCLSFSCRMRAFGVGMVIGALGGVVFFLVWRTMLWAACSPIPYALQQDVSVATVVTFGVPLSLACYLLTNFLMVGFCGPGLSELEREWWSSVNSRLMMLAVGWTALFGIAVFGPWLVGQVWLCVSAPNTNWYKLLTGTAGAGWLSTLAAGLKIAHGPGTSSTGRGGVKEGLARLAPVLFLITVLLAAAVLTTWLSYDVYAAIEEQPDWRFASRPQDLLTDLNEPKLLIPLNRLPIPFIVLPSVELPMAWLALAAACGLLSFSARALGDLVGVNTFTLQNLYANRLVRCYLGASKKGRKPEPVVNLDPADDKKISSLFPGPLFKAEQLKLKAEGAYDETETITRTNEFNELLSDENKKSWGPIHIINGALNQKASAVRPSDPRSETNGETVEERRAESLQFLERQAESFVFTPLYCGSEATGYCRSDEFAGDVKLGTAVAVSGAAVSPNMGYHSSPSVTALLTVFNIRLGAWFGNPCRVNSRSRANPAASAKLLFQELAGVTDAESDHVYVSDGGHFENMGVYELIRRRCRFIIAIDAGADPKFHENVGRVVRQVRIDFGIWIEVDMTSVTPGPTGLCPAHLVVGRIHYGDVHKPAHPDQHPGDPTFSHKNNHGIIVWIKNSLTGDEPGDLMNHAAMHPTFPYDSTLDQFFNEPQFESYRALGIHSILKSLILPAEPSKKDAPGVAQVVSPTRCSSPHEKIRNTSTRCLFETNFDFWLTKPAQFVTSYVHENETYAKIQAALRQDDKLCWLAKELYGTAKDRFEATHADRIKDRVAERLMVNEMLTHLENVFLSLDLERNGLHPVHSGWMGVYHHWLQTPSFKKFWPGQNERDGLCHEYSPPFRRFVDQVMKGSAEAVNATPAHLLF